VPVNGPEHVVDVVQRRNEKAISLEEETRHADKALIARGDEHANAVQRTHVVERRITAAH
jgi:hypothetical protein